METGEEMTDRADLSQLVRNRLDELGMSVRSLAEASTDPNNPDAGLQWTRGTLNNLVNGVKIKPPTFPQLCALAAGLQLPLGLIQEAAGAQFFGIDTVWSDDGQVRALVHDFLDLPPEDQEKVRALMDSWRRLKRE